MILFGPEKKQAHILHASGSSALWSCRTLQDPLCWLPASKSCNEKSDPSTSGKIQLKEGAQAAAVPSAGHHELSQSLFADCGELFACSSVYLRHVLSNYYQLLREITKDLPSTRESPQSRPIFQGGTLGLAAVFYRNDRLLIWEKENDFSPNKKDVIFFFLCSMNIPLLTNLILQDFYPWPPLTSPEHRHWGNYWNMLSINT